MIGETGMNMQKQSLQTLYSTGANNWDGAVFDYTNHPRPNNVLAFIESGSVEFCENSSSLHLYPGDIIFIPLGTCYYSVWHGSVKLTSVFYKFAPTAMPFAGKRYGMQILPGSDSMRAHMREIFALQIDPEQSLALLMHFYALLHEAYARIASERERLPDHRILRAVEYFDSGAVPPMSMNELAASCALSSPYFYSLFKRTTGMTPVEYKNRAAITRAEQLLLSEPQLSIEEISELTGFSSSSYFRRVFTEHTGMSPRDYRKNASI